MGSSAGSCAASSGAASNPMSEPYLAEIMSCNTPARALCFLVLIQNQKDARCVIQHSEPDFRTATLSSMFNFPLSR